MSHAKAQKCEIRMLSFYSNTFLSTSERARDAQSNDVKLCVRAEEMPKYAVIVVVIAAAAEIQFGFLQPVDVI